MKKLIYSTLLIAIMAYPVHAEQKFSFGLGVGRLYSGLGVNIALKDNRDMKYLAAGIPSATYTETSVDGHVDSKEWDVAFGISAGWVRTVDDLGKHGLGLFLDFSSGGGHDAGVVIGPSYTYFFSGMAESGFNVGVSTGIGFNEESSYFISVFPQIGYQF